MLATAELCKRAQNHAGQFTATAKKLADFLASVEAEETLRVQRLRDHEAKDVSKTADGAGVAAVEQASLAGSADQQDLEEVTAAANPGVAVSDQPTAYEEY
jgi:hypothetical protein